MTGTLALLGGAEWTDGVTLDAALAAESSATEVTILPTATAYENPGARVERAREAFSQYCAAPDMSRRGQESV